MIDKVLYRCPRCGHTYLDAGDGAITPKGKRVDGVVPVCAECFISNVTREPARMVQVWPAPSGWISVSDPPKTAGTHWIIWHGGRGAWMEAWWRDDSWWDSMGQIYGVTHYQPGPSAPE